MATLAFLYVEQDALVALGAGQTQEQFVQMTTSPLAVSAYQQAMADVTFYLSWGKALDLVVLRIQGILGQPLPPPGGQFPINGG